MPGSGVNAGEPGVHCITTPVMRCAKASAKDLVRRDQHGRDQRAVAECGDAVEGHLARCEHAADPRGGRRRTARIELEYFDGLAAAVIRRVYGVAASRRWTNAEAVEQRLLRIEGAWAHGVFRLVGARVGGAGGVEVLHRLRARIHEMQPAARRHATRQHPPRVRHEHEVFRIGHAANEREPARRRAGGVLRRDGDLRRGDAEDRSDQHTFHSMCLSIGGSKQQDPPYGGRVL